MEIELIDREYLRNVLSKYGNKESYFWKFCDDDADKVFEEMCKIIDSMPTTDSLVHAEWIHEELNSENSITGNFYISECYCSNCMCHVIQEANFCPNCGAKMDYRSVMYGTD